MGLYFEFLKDVKLRQKWLINTKLNVLTHICKPNVYYVITRFEIAYVDIKSIFFIISLSINSTPNKLMILM